MNRRDLMAGMAAGALMPDRVLPSAGDTFTWVRKPGVEAIADQCFDYHVTMQAPDRLVPVDAIRRVWVDGKLVYDQAVDGVLQGAAFPGTFEAELAERLSPAARRINEQIEEDARRILFGDFVEEPPRTEVARLTCDHAPTVARDRPLSEHDDDCTTERSAPRGLAAPAGKVHRKG